jgi:hypothetical protein
MAAMAALFVDFFLFDKKVNITHPNTLDIQFLEHTYHGNHQAAL